MFKNCSYQTRSLIICPSAPNASETDMTPSLNFHKCPVACAVSPWLIFSLVSQQGDREN